MARPSRVLALHQWHHWSSVLLAVLLLSACNTAGRDGDIVVETVDSAGITVVTSRAAVWGEGEGWSIDPEPWLSIGEMDGEGPAVFGEIGGAFRDRWDRIVVLDAQASELRFFDLEGRHLHSAGGPGRGPGEFQSVMAIVGWPLTVMPFQALIPWRADSILVHSMPGRETYVLGPDGDEARRIPAPMDWLWGVPGGETLLSTASGRLPGETRDGWALAPIVRYGPSGEADTLISLPWTLEGDFVLLSPFGSAVPSPHGFVAMRSDRPELRHFDLDGKLERIFRLPLEPPPIPPDFADSIQMETEYEIATTRPVFQSMRIDRDGYAWISGHQLPGRELDPELMVVSPEGRYLGVLSLPDRSRILHIGPDWILLLHLDPLDVPSVRLHALHRDGG